MKVTTFIVMSMSLCYLMGCEGTTDEVVMDEMNEEAVRLLQTAESHLIDDKILSTSDYQRQEFDHQPYLNVGDAVSIIENDQHIGAVTLQDIEVIPNKNGYQEKSIVLHFEERNESNHTLMLGDYSPDILTMSHLFYDAIYLDALTQKDQAYYDEFPTYENKTLCTADATLEKGESRDCYLVYSYAGEGDYVVNLATNVKVADRKIIGGWKSFKFNLQN